jgi:hypothetical protein
MDSKKSPKISKKYCCEKCDYITCKRRDYIKHLSTDKHIKRRNDSKMVVNDSDLSPKISEYKCNCGKIYKYDSGYYRHKKKCVETNSDTTESKIEIKEEEVSDKDLIMMLLKQNTQLIEQNAELIKNGTHTTTNSHNNTNSHNKTFNLNLFLNETCKDAMNIKDFVDSITLQLSDLEKIGELGYVEGISNIITNNLKALDVTQRPIHCTDKKREILYVKDEDKWDKENIEKKKLRKAIKHIAHKNSKLIPEFKDKYPDCVKCDSKKSDQYNNLIIEAMGGQGDNDLEKENQIIKNIAKEITIDKYVE